MAPARDRTRRSTSARTGSAVAATLRTDPGRTGLPERLSVFGVTRLDSDHRQVLDALAVHRDVHLWLAHPSPALWDHLAGGESLDTLPLRARDQSEQRVRHPLLAYLGRDVRELQLGLRAITASITDVHHPAPSVLGPPTTLLSRLQADIAADAEPRPPAERPLLDPDDRSVQVHSCHGPDRQVEVLREVLVGLLADDPTLQPRDIVVMCPDIETFAPLIAAAFGLDTAETEAEHPGHRLRVRLADRALRQVNPLLGLVGRLVQLADSRLEAAAVLDLCGTEPVARKFGFSTEDLDRLATLVTRSGVRWGLDPAHRARFGLNGFGQNTWAAGLDRLLLGVSHGRERPALSRHGAPARRRGRLRCRPGGPVRRVADPAPHRHRRMDRVAIGGRMDRRFRPGYRADDRRARQRYVAADPRSWSAQPDRRGGGRRLRHAVAARGGRAAHRRLPRPGQPGELPHRHPHHVHDAADALGAAPGRLPAGSR